MAEKDLFGLGLNGTPDLSKKIAFGEVGSVDENMTLEQLITLVTTNQDVYTQEQINNFFKEYLSKTNLTEFIPTEDFHPATKKYVDDKAFSITGQFAGSEFSSYTVAGIKTISFKFVSNIDEIQSVTFPDGGFATICTSIANSRDIIDQSIDGIVLSKTGFTYNRDNGVAGSITIYVTATGY